MVFASSKLYSFCWAECALKYKLLTPYKNRSYANIHVLNTMKLIPLTSEVLGVYVLSKLRFEVPFIITGNRGYNLSICFKINYIFDSVDHGLIFIDYKGTLR